MLAGPNAWAILVHDIDAGIPRHFVCKKRQHLPRPREILGQHQMPHQQPALRDALPVEHEIPCLAVHFLHRGAVGLDAFRPDRRRSLARKSSRTSAGHGW